MALGRRDATQPATPDLHESPDQTTRRRVQGALARVILYGLPALVLAVAFLGSELWPATEWRMFSGVRTGTQATWLLEVERADGSTERHHPEMAGPERRSWRHLLDRSVGDPARQLALCRQWLAEAAGDGPTIIGLSVHRAVIEVPRRAGQSAAVTWRREVVACER
jgi:hypothetical protein